MFDTRAARAVLATAAICAIVGCGSSSSGDDEQGSSEAYVQQVEQECLNLNRQAVALGRPADNRGLARVMRGVVVIRTEALPRFRAIEVPADVADEYERLLGMIAEQTDQFRRIGAAAAADDNARLRALARENERLGDEKSALMRRLGLDACAGREVRADRR